MNKLKILPCLLVGAVLMFLSACSSMDRIPMSSFEPFTDSNGQKMFRFRADSASIAYPSHTAEGEAVRMDWLKEYLRLNKMCLNGYRILERKEVVRSETISGDVHSIYYTGQCTSKP